MENILRNLLQNHIHFTQHHLIKQNEVESLSLLFIKKNNNQY